MPLHSPGTLGKHARFGQALGRPPGLLSGWKKQEKRGRHTMCIQRKGKKDKELHVKGREAETESLRMMALVANFPMETRHGVEKDWLASLFCQITPGSDHTKKEREG